MTKYLLICLVVCALIFQGCWHHESAVERGYNEKYIGEYTRKIAFPIGGIGTGMFCIEGTGALSNMLYVIDRMFSMNQRCLLQFM